MLVDESRPVDFSTRNSGGGGGGDIPQSSEPREMVDPVDLSSSVIDRLSEKMIR